MMMVQSLFVFGDSFSDTGNLFRLTSAVGNPTPPSPPYFNGRYSNGPLTVERLATQLGLNFNPDVNNFAIGGAQTGRGNLGDNPATGVDLPGLLDQIDLFRSRLGTGRADPNGVYFIWAGGNNFLSPPIDPQQAIVTAVSDITNAAATLASLGANQIVVSGTPNIGRLPLAIANNATQPLTQLSSLFNAALGSAIATLDNNSPANISFVNPFFETEALIANPSNFGFTNITTPLLTQNPVPSNPQQYFFFDDVHPTTQGHQFFANVYTQQFSGLTASRATNGNDNLTLNSFSERIQALAGNDLIIGGAGNDQVNGNGGNDTLIGNDGLDLLLGGKDTDSLLGGNGGDILLGNRGNDVLTGEAGDDFLYGGKGFDRINGGDGNDSLSGDLGADLLIGGSGNDWFILPVAQAVNDLAQVDFIQDFQSNADRIGIFLPNASLVNFRLNAVGGNTIISLNNTNQVLGIVGGVTPEQLNNRITFLNLDPVAGLVSRNP